MQRQNPYILWMATLLLALLFIFSGFVKIADPWGSAIKIEEYLVTYGIGWLTPLSMLLSITIATCELTMGLMLFLRVYLKPLSTLYLVVMTLFTAISALSATLLPIGSCGCFGEAIKLTPWQTLFKNIVLLTITIWLYLSQRAKHFEVSKRGNIGVVAIVLISLILTLCTLLTMPLLDFTAYKKGTSLREELYTERHEEAIQTTLIYRNIESGELHVFDIEDVEWRDSEVWEWVETRSQVTKSESTIYDFALYNGDREDVTYNILTSKKPVTLLIIKGVERLNKRCISWLTNQASALLSQGEEVYIINPQRMELLGELSKVETLTLDYTTLKTLLRPSIGAVRIVDGIITEKRRCR